jgi:hypothetical protein
VAGQFAKASQISVTTEFEKDHTEKKKTINEGNIPSIRLYIIVPCTRVPYFQTMKYQRLLAGPTLDPED